MGVYLRAKFEVSSIIQTTFSFRQGITPSPPPPLHTSKRTTKQLTQIRVNEAYYDFKKLRM